MNNNDIIIYILVSVLFMLLFASIVIWFLNQTQKKIRDGKIREQEKELVFQKELLKNTIKTQEQERDRIAKELHDDIASKLGIVHLNVHLLKKKIEAPQETLEIIDLIETSIKDSAEKTRSISHELMPLMLKKFGIHHSLNELVNTINITGIFELNIKDNHFIQITDKFKLLHIYRIIQELLNNAIKYSKAKKVSIIFRKENDFLAFSYNDDGVGFEMEDNKGFGWSNIHTRVSLLEGEVDLYSAPNKGTNINFKFPNLSTGQKSE